MSVPITLTSGGVPHHSTSRIVYDYTRKGVLVHTTLCGADAWAAAWSPHLRRIQAVVTALSELQCCNSFAPAIHRLVGATVLGAQLTMCRLLDVDVQARIRDFTLVRTVAAAASYHPNIVVR